MPRSLVAITMRIPLRAGGVVSTVVSSSGVNPTVVTTSSPHEIYTGERVIIRGHSTPAVNGEHPCTRLTATTFEIPVDGGLGGTGGTAQYAPPPDNRPGASRWSGARYPPFNELRIVKEANEDWAYYIDRVGIGWCYDAISGHREGGSTPVGQQEGCLLVPHAFAAQAIAAFGDAPFSVAAVTPAAFATFHDTRTMARASATIIDDRVLKPIEIKIARGQALTAREEDALDPAKSERGVVTNRRRSWSTRSVDEDVTVIAYVP